MDEPGGSQANAKLVFRTVLIIDGPEGARHCVPLRHAIGIGWFLRDVDGVRTIGHGGSANGQFTELLTAPDRDFAVVSLSNQGPHGIAFNQAVVRWALENCLGVIDRDPEPLPYDEARARLLVGQYENDMMDLALATDGAAITLAIDKNQRSGPPPRRSCHAATRGKKSACCQATGTSTSSLTAG